MATSGVVRAETLLDALNLTYRNNPSLGAARAGTLAAGENLPRAEAGYKPRLSARGEAGYRWGGQTATDRGDAYSLTLEATQPVFDGFRTRNSVGLALAQDQEARQLLRNSEHAILLAAVKAYVQSFSSQAVLKANVRYRAALQKQLKLVRSLHGFGDAVASDIAEVEARLAEAEAELSRAQAAVEQSAAEYERVIGKPPGRLEEPQALPGGAPSSREQAIALALAQHPALLAAQHAALQSSYQVAIVQSEFAPTVDIVGSASLSRDRSSRGGDAGIFARLNMPIYSGGEVMARSRQAKHVASQRQLDVQAVADRVSALVTVAWSSLADARRRIKAGRAQLRAASIALEGLRMAYKVGERSTFEVLDGERELYDAGIAVIAADRDYIIATYALSEARGLLQFSSVAEALRRQRPPRPAAKIAQAATPAKAKAKPKLRASLQPAADIVPCASCVAAAKVPPLRSSLTD